MNRDSTDERRRRLLRGIGLTVLAVPAAGMLGPRAAGAAEKPKLDPSQGQAKALQYVHDAAEASGNAAYQEGANCANCTHWTGGDSEWGGCNLFPNHVVAREGWCAAWAKA
ncbi:MAG: high-potential iron-sulfur protein [Halofilum sp. (in: g-proteobacteria)]|nr:high-potential iron-sulfur protein [Halofilum sp. (in: g-proteobacteria)]